ncbi:MAG: amidophosphoribosyltransferase [Anaerolineales bacterium]|nr:amidophosphoribosyltransferase [Anaerolineales bacterium]
MQTLTPNQFPFSDKPKDECGVFGISTKHQNSARITYFGIFALQHRGQEAAGIAVSDGEKMRIHKSQGLVSQVFTEENISNLTGHLAIGHTRYSTTGSSNLRNVQPMLLDTRYGPVALAHNGNLVNAVDLRAELFEQGVGFASTSDSEVIITMLAAAKGEDWLDRIANTMPNWKGAFSLVILTIDGVYAARDPWGLRPLTVGRLPGGGYAVASESGALETIGCDSIREVNSGEVIALHNQALIVRQAIPPAERQAKCTFEHIYFSRPDSIWDGKVVHDVRVRLGRQLAIEYPTEADVVIPVPDSSIPATLGYSSVSGIPYDIGLLKNIYIGRTFIQPSQEMRGKDVKLKFNAIPSVLHGKRVIVIDDSIVRGTTSKHLVEIIRKAGAKEVHFRVTCPPITNPCYMGVDMSTHNEMIAHNKSVEEIRAYLQADSLYYVSMAGMMEAIGASSGYCNACFTGDYPFEIATEATKLCLESRLD